MIDKKLALDDTDKKILSFLIKDARTPFLQIARECGISGAAIHQRVKKLEEAGVIIGSHFDVSPQAIGLDVCAIIGIVLSEGYKFKIVEEKLKKIPQVIECHFTTGKFSFIIKVICKDNNDLKEILINTLHNIPGIENTTTYVSLEQIINKTTSI